MYPTEDILKEIIFHRAKKMFHLQRFFSMEQAPPQPDEGGDESFSGVGGETDSTSAEG